MLYSHGKSSMIRNSQYIKETLASSMMNGYAELLLKPEENYSVLNFKKI